MEALKRLLRRLFYRLRKPEIRVSEAKLSGDGNLIDIRYWLSRPDLFNPDSSVFLTHDETGESLFVLRISKFGPVRTKHTRHQNAGNLLLYNKNGIVKHGTKVTLHFDAVSIGDIVVQ